MLQALLLSSSLNLNQTLDVLVSLHLQMTAASDKLATAKLSDILPLTNMGCGETLLNYFVLH
jgi:hypothetical protein